MGDALVLRGLVIRAGDRALVRDVDLTLQGGRIVGLVGASGCGKTLTALALLGLVDLAPGVVAADLEVCVGDEVVRPYESDFSRIRGRLVGYLPQDARAALDPLQRVGRQVGEAAVLAGGTDDPLPWLTRAGLPDAPRVARLHPHQLSGGMAQRVVIAQALARGSRFLLADEPTTGLDPTVQRGILDEIRQLAREGIGVLLITHDLRILPDLADEVLVMENGQVVETLPPVRLMSGELQSEPGRRLVAATRRVAGGRLG